MKIPKTLGACADRLLELRHAKAELNRALEALEEERRAVEAKLIAELPKSEAAGVTGHAANARVVTKQVPTAKDWDQIYKHVLRTKDFALLQRRLSEGAVKELWEAGKAVPGVEAFTVVTVSVTQAKGG